MTPEEGYRLAQFQRPGIKIVMGPTEAREDRIAPRAVLYGKAWGDTGAPTPVLDTATSWFEYDCARLVGKLRLSPWVTRWCAEISSVADRLPTEDEVAFLLRPATGLAEARKYVESLRDA